jgi:hypothetical protein
VGQRKICLLQHKQFKNFFMANIPEPIDIGKSNEYILINRAIRARMKTWAIIEINNRKAVMNAPLPNIPADGDGFIKAQNFFSDLSNAFVFRKEDFERFFNGDPNDPTHPDLKFSHCMIIVGALKRDETDAAGHVIKKRGEQTVLIAGCTPLDTDPDKFVTTSDGTQNGPGLINVATEHPPKGFKVRIQDPTFRGAATEAPHENILMIEQTNYGDAD